MPDCQKRVVESPQIRFGGHPVHRIETSEILRLRVSAQGPFALQIVVMLEIRHDEFPYGAVDGFSKAETCEIRFPDRPPAAILSEHRQNVVVVLGSIRFEVNNEGRMSVDAQGSHRQQSSFKAMARPVAQHTPRRAACFTLLFFVVRNVFIDETLDLFGCVQPLENLQFLPR